MEANLEFTTVVKREGDGYVAICPEIGTRGAGLTREEAIEKLRLTMKSLLDEVVSRYETLT